jgi:uncharacterized membrane protein YheB (UPF0754 family)
MTIDNNKVATHVADTVTDALDDWITENTAEKIKEEVFVELNSQRQQIMKAFLGIKKDRYSQRLEFHPTEHQAAEVIAMVKQATIDWTKDVGVQKCSKKTKELMVASYTADLKKWTHNSWSRELHKALDKIKEEIMDEIKIQAVIVARKELEDLVGRHSND